MIRVTALDPKVRELLVGHPMVELAGETADLEFDQGSWHRVLKVGDPTVDISGLVELMDNNPMVCADVVSVPDLASTLALITLGPIIRSGLLVESPALLYSFDPLDAPIDPFLHKFGWTEAVTLGLNEADFGSVVAVTAFAKMLTPTRPADLDDLYDEAYARSFYVRNVDDDAAWTVDAVRGKPHAMYRLRFSAGEEYSLLTIHAMLDRDGKGGAAQVVHAMNVMAGFEETLGL